MYLTVTSNDEELGTQFCQNHGFRMVIGHYNVID